MGPPWPPATDGRPGSRVTSPGLPPPPGPVAVRCVCVCCQIASSVAASPRIQRKTPHPRRAQVGRSGKLPEVSVAYTDPSPPARSMEPDAHVVRRSMVRSAPEKSALLPWTTRGRRRWVSMVFLYRFMWSESAPSGAPMAPSGRSFVLRFCALRLSVGTGWPSPIPGPRTPARGHPRIRQKKIAPPMP